MTDFDLGGVDAELAARVRSGLDQVEQQLRSVLVSDYHLSKRQLATLPMPAANGFVRCWCC